MSLAGNATAAAATSPADCFFNVSRILLFNYTLKTNILETLKKQSLYFFHIFLKMSLFLIKIGYFLSKCQKKQIFMKIYIKKIKIKMYFYCIMLKTLEKYNKKNKKITIKFS